LACLASWIVACAEAEVDFSKGITEEGTIQSEENGSLDQIKAAANDISCSKASKVW